MNVARNRRIRSRQRGVTMIVGLIMLVLLTLLVLASFQLGKTNLEIVGNAQDRGDSVASAQQTIEAAISSPLLTTSPGAIFPNPCNTANTLCYDVNGDGTNDVSVTLTPTPTCVKAEVIKNKNLDLSKEDDRRCTIGIVQSQFGIENTSGSDSLCSNSLWDVRAQAQDTTTKAQAVVEEGVAVRVRTTDVDTSCPLP
jgi:Tfp pilus assembly protein PilX